MSISLEEVEQGEFRVRGQPGLHTDLPAHWQAYVKTAGLYHFLTVSLLQVTPRKLNTGRHL